MKLNSQVEKHQKTQRIVIGVTLSMQPHELYRGITAVNKCNN